MNERRWKTLADLILWAQVNYDILQHTKAILPGDWQTGKMEFAIANHLGQMPRQNYGYLHAYKDKCILALRNTWIACSNYNLKLDENLQLHDKNAQYSIISIYPEVRKYGQNLHFGQDINIPLAPYETLVLQIEKGKKANMPLAAIGSSVIIKNLKQKIDSNEKYPFEAHVQGDIEVNSQQSQVLVLLEGKKAPAKPEMNVTLNGKTLETYSVESVDHIFTEAEPNDTGWASSWAPIPESWRFVIADLESKNGTIDLKVSAGPDCEKISAWVIAMKSQNNGARHKNMLPSPERIYLDSKVLLEPTTRTAVRK
jgi:hypothetical protein